MGIYLLIVTFGKVIRTHNQLPGFLAFFLFIFIKPPAMDTAKIDKLFEEYEHAFDQLDTKQIAHYYGESFVSAGPKGTIAQNKKDFMSKAEQAQEMYKSIGQNGATLVSKKITPISKEYSMVTVHWGVTYEKTGTKMVEFDVSYIVQDIGGDLQIILFITHQDEAEAMRKLGLQPELVK